MTQRPRHGARPSTCPVCGRTELPSSRWTTGLESSRLVPATVVVDRLHRVAAEVGIAVIEHPSVKETGCAAALSIDQDLESSQVIMLADDLDDALRADVMAFGFAVLGAIPDTIADSPDGYLLVGRQRRPTSPDSVSHVAWHIARLFGHYTYCTTFDLLTPTPDRAQTTP